MTAPRILIVEDELAISQVCERVLTAEGFKVDVAIDGKAAQQMIEKEHFDYCLIDIRTPVMNGIDLFRWLEVKQPALAKRVVFTTGDVMGSVNAKFLEDTNALFLQKPFSPNDLRNIIRKAAEQSAG